VSTQEPRGAPSGTTESKDVTVVCRNPACNEKYPASYRDQIDQRANPEMGEKEVEEATTGTCPRCGLIARFQALLITPDGTLVHLPRPSDRLA